MNVLSIRIVAVFNSVCLLQLKSAQQEEVSNRRDFLSSLGELFQALLVLHTLEAAFSDV